MFDRLNHGLFSFMFDQIFRGIRRRCLVAGVLFFIGSLRVLPVLGQLTNLKFTNYTINNGLSEGTISSITQDHQGFMWFGTMDGLDRFDGYEFMVFRHDPFDSTSLSDNSITKLFMDSRNQLWVGTLHGGLNLFDPLNNRFIHFLDPSADNEKDEGDYIRAIAEDAKGNLWIGVFGNGIYEFEFGNKKMKGLYLPEKIIHYTKRTGNDNGLGSNFINYIFPDKEGHLWVSSNDGPLQEVDLNKDHTYFSTPRFLDLNPEIAVKDQIVRYDFKNVICSKLKKPHPYVVYNMYEDEGHNLWMAGNGGLYILKAKSDTLINIQPTLGPIHVKNVTLSVTQGMKSHIFWLGIWAGLGIFNTKNFTLQLISHREGDNTSLLGGVVSCIYKDRSGCVWLGTNGYGVSKYTPMSSLFNNQIYYSQDRDTSTESFSVISILDTKRFLLLGTYDSLWIVNKNTGILSMVSGGLTTDNMIPADSGKIWLAGVNGLSLYDPENGKSVLFSPHIVSNGKEDNRVIKIFNDGDGDLWLLTTLAFCRFDLEARTFTKYFYRKILLNQAYNFHGDIYRDNEGNFWLGTEVGLLYFDTLKKTFHRYVNDPKDTSSLSFNNIECVVPDSKMPAKYLWIGTQGGGLNKFSLITKKFTRFTIKDGLPNNTINGILTDDKGNLWISTNNGLSRFNPTNQTFHNYDVHEGFSSNEFNHGAYYKNDEGQFFFGNISGFNSFYPDSIQANPYHPPVVFTDFRLFNNSVRAGINNSPLKEPITLTHSITLPYNDNLISFQVASMDYNEPEKNRYAYLIKGLSDYWIDLGHDRLITLGNLLPGHYVLEVRATNSDGIWSGKPVLMNIRITPPWWKTWWAYLCYVAILFVLIMLIREEELIRIRLRNRLQLERFEADKLKDVDRMKSRFFANISHEFRTPLTLIIGPLKDMLQGGSPEKFRAIIPAMYRNSQRLLQLVNQLLDLSKLDSGYYKINTTRTDIVSYVKQVTSIFLNLAKRKNIHLSVRTEDTLLEELHGGINYFYFDEDVVEKVLTNLISNAFKFTPEGGEVTVYLELAGGRQKYVALRVSDNGDEIPADKLPFVFDRFYQADDSSNRKFEGSGIGLALVKELVELHGGKVIAESSRENGTIFSCWFPFNKRVIAVDKTPPEAKPDKIKMTIEPESLLKGAEVAGNGSPTILVIEDNRDVRKYICDKLGDDYRIRECKDGKEGLLAAFEEIPDLVISDVMMPEMDGYELCKKLKTDNRTSHIPIILLTARAEDADKMQGLSTGADAYMIKPFNTHELQIRITKLIELRNKMRAKFSEKLAVKPSEIAVSSFDRDFISKLQNIAEKHMDEVDFTVEQLSREMNMSVSQLNRKLKAIINQTSSQYITSLRMQRAMDLLKNNGGNIAEISWKTGYEDPGYFSKVFKAYYGFLPSEKERFKPDV